MLFKDRTLWFMLIVLWGFWLAVTGVFDWQNTLLGLVVAFFISCFNYSMLITSRERPAFTVKNIKWGLYFVRDLFFSMLKANIQVAAMVLNPRLPLHPGVVEFEVDLKKPASMVILANAITLTPGTLTVFCGEEEVLVHALSEKSAEGVARWKLIEELKEMEG